jgi:hypothetical protein
MSGRHAGENRHPVNGFWIPAFAGMTVFYADYLQDSTLGRREKRSKHKVAL